MCVYKEVINWSYTPTNRQTSKRHYTTTNTILRNNFKFDSSDRFTANSETCDTVAHESHNYLYSSLSYFSDISDHNNQVARINEYQKIQTDEFQDCKMEIHPLYEMKRQGVTSHLGICNTGSEFSHIVPDMNKSTTLTQVIPYSEEYEHEKPLVHEFGFIPEKIPVIHCTAKNQAIEFRNSSQ